METMDAEETRCVCRHGSEVHGKNNWPGCLLCSCFKFRLPGAARGTEGPAPLSKYSTSAIDLLQHWKNVTVFYGHIHQEHHFRTGAIAHHAAQSLIFPLPAPLSQPKRAPVPWDPAHPRRGLGFREISAGPSRLVLALGEHSLESAAAAQATAVGNR